MAYLLELAERPDGHGIRAHSLKVTTISALVAEMAKSQANLLHLAIQGNYSARAAHDLDAAYSRNISQRQLFERTLV